MTDCAIVLIGSFFCVAVVVAFHHRTLFKLLIAAVCPLSSTQTLPIYNYCVGLAVMKQCVHRIWRVDSESLSRYGISALDVPFRTSDICTPYSQNDFDIEGFIVVTRNRTKSTGTVARRTSKRDKVKARAVGGALNVRSVST